MRTLGHDPTQAELEDMIKSHDLDNSKTIDFSEFLSLMTPKVLELDEQEARATTHTHTHTTTTAHTNANTVAKRTRVKSTRTKAVERDRDIQEAFKVLDQNGDGYISATEVKQVLRNFGNSLSSFKPKESSLIF